jgi:hypothetical protein
MPLPKPHDGEKEEDFIERCMADEVMEDEYPDEEQRLAICSDLWDDGKAIAVLDIERKAVTLKLDEEKEGTFLAKIATLNVIDKDGDVTLPGAFPQGKEILVSAYMHGSWMGTLPVGKAVISEDGEDVLAKGEFNLKTDEGRNHYEAVKFSGGLQEWSYGFKVLAVANDKTVEAWAAAHDGARPGRIMKSLDPFEISPVLLGAGIDTATLAIKSQATYADQAEAALAAVTELVNRTKSLADLRRKEGRVLSSKNRERISKLLASLSAVASDLKELLEATEPDDTEKLAQAVMIFTKIKRELAEVS